MAKYHNRFTSQSMIQVSRYLSRGELENHFATPPWGWDGVTTVSFQFHKCARSPRVSFSIHAMLPSSRRLFCLSVTIKYLGLLAIYSIADASHSLAPHSSLHHQMPLFRVASPSPNIILTHFTLCSASNSCAMRVISDKRVYLNQNKRTKPIDARLRDYLKYQEITEHAWRGVGGVAWVQ